MTDYISFPGLGWKFNISPTIVEFQLFGIEFSLKWYGLLIAIGFLLAVIYALKRCKEFEVDGDALIDVTLVSALFAFLGARLYYVLFSSERSEYFSDPLSIFRVWEGGLAIYGGIIFAFGTAIWMCRVRKVNLLAMCDIASIGFLIGQAIGRWGNFFNQEAFGGNTTLPWGMSGSIIKAGTNGSGYNTALPVHPTFLYESLWCLLGFIVLHLISKKAYKFKGELFSLYIMWYGAGRLVIEGLRTDSLYFGAIRISQLIAGLSILGGLVLFFLLRSRANASPKDLFPVEQEAGATVPLREDIEEEEEIEGEEAEEVEEEEEEVSPTEASDDEPDADIDASDDSEPSALEEDVDEEASSSDTVQD